MVLHLAHPLRKLGAMLRPDCDSLQQSCHVTWGSEPLREALRGPGQERPCLASSSLRAPPSLAKANGAGCSARCMGRCQNQAGLGATPSLHRLSSGPSLAEASSPSPPPPPSPHSRHWAMKTDWASALHSERTGAGGQPVAAQRLGVSRRLPGGGVAVDLLKFNKNLL